VHYSHLGQEVAVLRGAFTQNLISAGSENLRLRREYTSRTGGCQEVGASGRNLQAAGRACGIDLDVVCADEALARSSVFRAGGSGACLRRAGESW